MHVSCGWFSVSNRSWWFVTGTSRTRDAFIWMRRVYICTRVWPRTSTFNTWRSTSLQVRESTEIHLFLMRALSKKSPFVSMETWSSASPSGISGTLESPLDLLSETLPLHTNMHNEACSFMNNSPRDAHATYYSNIIGHNERKSKSWGHRHLFVTCKPLTVRFGMSL